MRDRPLPFRTDVLMSIAMQRQRIALIVTFSQLAFSATVLAPCPALAEGPSKARLCTWYPKALKSIDEWTQGKPEPEWTASELAGFHLKGRLLRDRLTPDNGNGHWELRCDGVKTRYLRADHATLAINTRRGSQLSDWVLASGPTMLMQAVRLRERTQG